MVFAGSCFGRRNAVVEFEGDRVAADPKDILGDVETKHGPSPPDFSVADLGPVDGHRDTLLRGLGKVPVGPGPDHERTSRGCPEVELDSGHRRGRPCPPTLRGRPSVDQPARLELARPDIGVLDVSDHGAVDPGGGGVIDGQEVVIRGVGFAVGRSDQAQTITVTQIHRRDDERCCGEDKNQEMGELHG